MTDAIVSALGAILAELQRLNANLEALPGLVKDLRADLKRRSERDLKADGAIPPGAPTGSTRTRGQLPTTFPSYGQRANGPIAGASPADLDYYGSRARKGAVEKTGWKQDNDRLLVEAIDAEIARPSAPAPTEPAPDFGAGTDDDIPF